MPNRMKHFPGDRFGRLVISSRNGRAIYCLCDCGNTTTVQISDLISKSTVSCGCLQIEGLICRSVTHGKSKTRAYKAWVNIRDRCVNSSRRDWPRYGGRGITVSEEWRSSFENFYADMGDPPEGHSIDRKDNDGPYSKENCRWATPREQNRNRSDNRIVTLNGRTQILQDWAKETGLQAETISGRIRRGWTVERALTQPSKIRRARKAKLLRA